MSNREAMLLEVIRIVRCHPDFDNGGPMADMMDQALAGVEHPDAVVAIANLARGLKPPPVAPRPEGETREAIIEECAKWLETNPVYSTAGMYYAKTLRELALTQSPRNGGNRVEG